MNQVEIDELAARARLIVQHLARRYGLHVESHPHLSELLVIIELLRGACRCEPED